jgi:hypothetical protein
MICMRRASGEKERDGESELGLFFLIVMIDAQCIPALDLIWGYLIIWCGQRLGLD